MTKSEVFETRINAAYANKVPYNALHRSSVQGIDTSVSDQAINATFHGAFGVAAQGGSMALGYCSGLVGGAHGMLSVGSGLGSSRSSGFAVRSSANAHETFGVAGYLPANDDCGNAVGEIDGWIDNTIVEIPFDGNRPAAPSESGPVSVAEHDRAINRRTFRIRPADDRGRRTAAGMLINKMYSQRGYETGFLEHSDQPNRITLVASDDASETLGTLSLGLDSDAGLLVDEMYRDEVDAVRMRGRSVCEFTKLAIDQQQGSKPVLGALFHITYIYARYLNQCTDLFIEVNPRHAPFYRRMLGFKQCGETRICPRVNAPAVLLRLELDYVDEQIRALGGQAGTGVSERSLYPYFFSKHEEAGISRRLRTLG